MSQILRRRSVRVALILLVLILVLVVAARILVPAEKVRQLVVRNIEQATGADVRFGDASVRLLPRLRVVVSDGVLTGTGEALQQAADVQSNVESYGVTIERLEIDLALLPLLKRRIETGTIRLVKPDLDLVTTATAAAAGDDSAGGPPVTEADGQPGPAAPPATAQPAAMPWQLAVAGIEISDGKVRWREVGSGKEITVTGWRQDIVIGDMSRMIERLNAFQFGVPPLRTDDSLAEFRLRTGVDEIVLSGLQEKGPLRLQELALEGTLSAPPAADHLGIRIESFTWQGLQLSGDLELLPASAPAPQLTGAWQLKPVELAGVLADLMALVPHEESPAQQWLQSGPVRGGRLALAGRLELPWPLPPDVSASALLAGVQIEGELTAGRLALPQERGEVNLAAALNVAAGVMKLDRLEISDGRRALTATGEVVAPLPDVAGPVTGRFSGSVDLAALPSYLPELAAAGEGRGAGPLDLAGRVNWSLSANIADPPDYADKQAWLDGFKNGSLGQMQLEAQADDVRLAGLTPGPTWQSSRVTLRGDLKGAVLSCTGLSHPTLQGDATYRLASYLPLPRGALDLALARVDIDKIVELFSKPNRTAQLGTESPLDDLINGLVAVAVAAAPETAATRPLGELLPQDLKLTITGQAREVILQKARYDSVRMVGELAEKVLRFSSVTARRSTGSLQGQGQIDYAADPYGALSFSAEAKSVPAAALLAPYAPNLAPLWEGSVNAKTSGSMSLKDEATVLKSLTLDGDALSSNGVIKATSLLAGVTPYLGNRQDLTLIRFKEFFHKLEVRQGRYHVQDLKLKGPDTDWWGDGWLGFDGGIDMTLRVKLPAGFSPQLGELTPLVESLRGDDGRIELAMHLVGRAASPKVDLDLSAAKERAQQKVEEGVKEGVKGILDKLKRK